MSRDARSRPAWVIAHRGASRDCPENTLAAFDEALRQGADGIELDVQLSRDGVPVVYHDRTLARAGGGRRRVAQLDLAELTGFAAGLPTLEQVLRRYGRRTRLLVEIKTREGRRGQERHFELARTVSGLVTELKLERTTSLLSFDAAVLQASAQAAPRVRRVLNLEPPQRIGRELGALLPSLSAVSADVRTLTVAFGRAVRAAGRPLFAYTCNTAARVERALAAGACGIMSDRPAWLAGRLENRRA